MEFSELMKERYSVRSFSDREVEEEKLQEILKAGQIAPTAVNFQPQRILVIRGAEMEKILRCTPCHFGQTLVLLNCYDKTACWTRGEDGRCSGDIDCSIVMTHMMLRAWELGIGSTWVMRLDEAAVRREFDLPENLVPVGLLVMGYASDAAEPSPRHALRKELGELVFEGDYGKSYRP